LLPNSFQMPEIPMSLEQIKQSAEGQVKWFLEDTQSIIDKLRK
jgi:hypothetical protein